LFVNALARELMTRVAGLLPAVKGSMTQVADNLAQNY
jgi:hypothetical protein